MGVGAEIRSDLVISCAVCDDCDGPEVLLLECVCVPLVVTGIHLKFEG